MSSIAVPGAALAPRRRIPACLATPGTHSPRGGAPTRVAEPPTWLRHEGAPAPCDRTHQTPPGPPSGRTTGIRRRDAAPRRAWHTDLPVLLVAVCWGASYLAAKDITTARTVLAVLVLRFALAVPVLAVAGRRGLRALTGAQWRGAALLGLILSGIFLLETYGVVHTSATNAGLIISLTMVFTPLAEAAVTRTRPTPAFLGAALLSVLGVVLLTQGGGFTRPSTGDLLMLLAALARTLHVLAMSRLRAVQGADALPLTTVQLGAAVAVFALLSAVSGGHGPWTVAADFGARDWAGLLFLSALCTVFAFFVQMWAVRRTSPSRVGLLLGTEPLWAAAAGIALGGERLGALGLAGGALVLVGTAWGRRTAG